MNDDVMDNDDLSGAVKNGIERGESIDSIRGSLVNAGYDSINVEMAMQKNAPNFGSVKIETVSAVKATGVEQEYPMPQSSEMKKLPSNIIVTNGHSSTKLIVLFLVFLLLILAIGGILIWLFWDQIVNALA